jgi:glycosyltransferase involved in cell wall biosynthesis
MLPEVIKQLPGARLLLVGSGVEEPMLRAMAKDLGNSVIFAGQVPHAMIRDFYSLIDVFVCPRLRMRLTELVTPLKPLEAMAMAKPVLASDVGGLKELIRHEATGLLFPAENQEAFVAQAIRAGSSPRLRTILGEAARYHVARERTWEQLVSQNLRLYMEMMPSRLQNRF